MNVQSRLLLTWTAVATVLLAPSLFALNRVVKLRDIAYELGIRHRSAYVALGGMQTELARMERFQVNYVAFGSPVAAAEVRASLAGARDRLDQLASAGHAGLAANAEVYLDSIEDATSRLDSLIAAGMNEDATALLGGVRPLYTRASNAIDELAEELTTSTELEVDAAREMSDTVTRTLVGALVAALLLALAIAYRSTSALTSPLRRVAREMAKVAGGEFTPPDTLPYARADEIGALARSFRTMTLKLSEVDRLKAEFVSVASHELKSPLNVISGYAELLQRGTYGPVSEKQQSVLSTISAQAHALARRVSQLLDISRIEAGGLSVSRAPIQLHEFVDDVDRAYQAIAEQRGISFIVEVDPLLPSTFDGDADRLRQEVLGNLLSNAFKFTESGGAIRLAASRSAGNQLELAVSDTGPGISPDEMSRIFDKYYQVGRQARNAGAGLGLAIAREVVLAHGGTITAESRKAGGSTFRVRLPLADSLAPAENARVS